MSRLTNDTRSIIRKRLFEHAFAARDAAMDAEEHDVARKVYAYTHPPAVLKAVTSLPKGFMAEADHIDVRIDGQSRRLNLGDNYRLSYDIMRNYTALSSGELIGKVVKDFHDKKAAYEAEKEKRKRETRTVLASINTVKRLIEVWPAVETLVADLLGSKPVTALALPIRDLNVALGLPPDVEKKSAKKPKTA